MVRELQRSGFPCYVRVIKGLASGKTSIHEPHELAKEV